jgi:dipeptidyl aminopeptidase/acylaminoacyl peptidase
MRNLALVLLATVLILMGCGESFTPATPAPTSIQPTITATEAFTPTTVSTATVVPTATQIPNPMNIAVMRMRTYDGSDIVIQSELERGRNYRRYYAYYISDNLKIYGLLTIPNGTMPEGGWPAIVFNHGYISPEVYKTTERYVAYVDQLASHGYIVYRIDYRGHDRSEGAAVGAYGDPGYTADVLNAVASLKRFSQVNPEKIGAWGHSMGGYLTLRSMVITKDIKVGVIWAGVVASYPDMLYNWRRSSAVTPSPSSRGIGWRTRWISEYGTPEQNPDFWNTISSTSYLADLSGPLQLHHGTADEDVPVEFSIRLAEQARAAGKIADLYLYEGDNHNISNNFDLAMKHTIEFFDQYLK